MTNLLVFDKEKLKSALLLLIEIVKSGSDGEELIEEIVNTPLCSAKEIWEKARELRSSHYYEDMPEFETYRDYLSSLEE